LGRTSTGVQSREGEEEMSYKDSALYGYLSILGMIIVYILIDQTFHLVALGYLDFALVSGIMTGLFGFITFILIITMMDEITKPETKLFNDDKKVTA
jgi:hypothetical protein